MTAREPGARLVLTVGLTERPRSTACFRSADEVETQRLQERRQFSFVEVVDDGARTRGKAGFDSRADRKAALNGMFQICRRGGNAAPPGKASVQLCRGSR